MLLKENLVQEEEIIIEEELLESVEKGFYENIEERKERILKERQLQEEENLRRHKESQERRLAPIRLIPLETRNKFLQLVDESKNSELSICEKERIIKEITELNEIFLNVYDVRLLDVIGIINTLERSVVAEKAKGNKARTKARTELLIAMGDIKPKKSRKRKVK